MATPAPAPLPGEPFSEALSEAAQAAAMSVRLLLTVTDAVRRAAQRHHHGRESDPGQETEAGAPARAAEELRAVLPGNVLAGLMAGEDWPVMARQLAGLQHAGVDLAVFLPQLGHMAQGVHQAVAKTAARTKAEGTDRWADLLRRTMPQGLVREAILASPAWPHIASVMARLDDRGVDVARVLADAHAAGTGVDRAVAALTTQAAVPPPAAATPAAAAVAAPVVLSPTSARAVPVRSARPALAPAPVPVRTAAGGREPDPWAAPAVSTDAKQSWGPLTEGLDVPRDLDLGSRTRALRQLGVGETAHTRLVAALHGHLPEREAALLVSARQWPLLAARMHRMNKAGAPVEDHLARLAAEDAPWRRGPASDAPGRLLLATHQALTTPLDVPLPAGPRVSTAAARSRSTTTPTPPAAGPAPAPAPGGPAVPAHRQPAVPARRQGRGR
ncbi:hypothetical protein [Streptomyces liangshanensis]|uniref:hypothetical protein n=1 Tax=Streptomyces liangshanensis TaxID=2717324 RepID=UPI0036DE64BB